MFFQTALICLLLGTVSPFPHYLVLIPAELRTDVPERVCVLNPYGQDGTLLTLTITNERRNSTVLQEEHSLPTGHHCFGFTIGEEEMGSDVFTILAVSVLVRRGEAARNETKMLPLRRYESLTFIQSDKVVYKPGQEVRFRIVSLNESFQPLDEEYPLVTVWDPAQNRVAQWRGVQAKGGIAEVAFQLTQKPPQGGYRIMVQKNRGRKEHYFSVEEYVLPTAELKVTMPHKITVLHRSINVRVCGRYTFGKPLDGKVSGSVCYSGNSHFCHSLNNQTDPEGCVEYQLPTGPFRLKWASYYRVIEASFKLTETGTDVETLGGARTDVVSEITSITFQRPAKYYKPGMAFHGEVQLAYSTGPPVPNASVYLFNSATPGAQKLTTDSNGFARFSLKTQRDWSDLLSFTAIYQGQYMYHYGSGRVKHNSGQMDVRPFYSSTGSYLSIHPQDAETACDSLLDLTIDYLVNGLPSDSQQPLTIFQLVLSKGIIVRLESISLSFKNGQEGHFSFPLSVSADISPLAQLLVLMVHPNGEVIADQTDIEVSKCFRNQVSLHFSEEEELPKGRISLEVGAGAESLCALRVVDHSVLLLKPERELSAESVYSLLPVQRLSSNNYQVYEPERTLCHTEDHPSIAYYNEDLGDVAHLLQDMGLKILTDLEYHRPVSCVSTEPAVPGEMAYSRRVFAMDSMQTPQLEPYTNVRLGFSPRTVHEVRSYFPETWVWELVNIGSSGSLSVPLTVPDSITEWKASAFCTGHEGFGISSTTSLRAFKPFFLEVGLPYSIVRKESFTLKAKVFNYLKECIMVKVSLLEAEGFNTTGELEDHQSCICSQEAQTFSWPLVAAELGKHNLTVQAESIASESLCGNEVIIVPKKGAIDIIRKPLLVKAEGVEIELTHSSFICPSGRTVSEKIHLHLPETVVQGSAWAYLAVQGDILGSAMENLDGLLRLPTGCGEQNMVKFAPNVYIHTYLNKTHQLTRTLHNKAIGYLRTGYQNQLTYKHVDGSFSAFGNHDPEGNTWLTAFVLKSFVKARPFIFIDDDVVRGAVQFFLNNRVASGCFAQRGSLFNNAMKGGVDDQVSVCAYITSALLEFINMESEMADSLYRKWRGSSINHHNYFSGTKEKEPTTHSPTIEEQITFREGVITRALSSLASELESVNSTYTLSLLAYAFTLAGDRDTRASLLDKLRKRAQEGGGLTHWQREDSEEDEEDPGFWWRAPSAEVEMTSYVLLALLSGTEVTKSELDQAVPIVSWLVRQRNSYGGFATTQDTVIALQALALYAELTYVSEADSFVSLTSPSGSRISFHVDSGNKLLLQRHSLPDVPGDYMAEITGTSCLLLQSTLHYNVPPAQKDPAFNISADIFHPVESEYFLTILLTFTGVRPVSNMVIVDIALLSGFSTQEDSYLSSKDSSNVSRSEMQEDHLVLYLSPMERDRPVYLSMKLSHDVSVENQQPAIIKVYDYYETGDSVVTQYEAVEPKLQVPAVPH